MHSMQDFLNFLILGLTRGSMYALIALGYTLVYGVLQLINFAHSEVFMSGAFGSYLVVNSDRRSDGASPRGTACSSVILLGLALRSARRRRRRLGPGTGGLSTTATARCTQAGVPDQCDRRLVLPRPSWSASCSTG